MEESKLEKAEKYLGVSGAAVFIVGLVLAIVSSIIYGAGGHEEKIGFIICILGLLLETSMVIIMRIDISKHAKEEEMKECEQKLIDDSWVQISEHEQRNIITGERRLGKTVKLEPLKMDLEKEVENMYLGENMYKTKIEKTIADDVKRLFGLDIGERFILKKEASDMNCFIDKEGKLIENFDGTYILKYYDIVPIDYKMLIILIGECGYSIEKVSKKVDKKAVEDFAEELERAIKKLERAIKKLEKLLKEED